MCSLRFIVYFLPIFCGMFWLYFNCFVWRFLIFWYSILKLRMTYFLYQCSSRICWHFPCEIYIFSVSCLCSPAVLSIEFILYHCCFLSDFLLLLLFYQLLFLILFGVSVPDYFSCTNNFSAKFFNSCVAELISAIFIIFYHYHPHLLQTIKTMSFYIRLLVKFHQ